MLRIAVVALLVVGCKTGAQATGDGAGESGPESTQSSTKATAIAEAKATAVFAGGCFWCMEGPFDALDGVSETTSGYIGGSVPNPTYEQVSGGNTGHTEALRIVFDPLKVSYEKLLEVFWRNIDPLDAGGQFCDRGSQYRSGIFFTDKSQQAAAEKSKAALAESGKLPGTIVTEITEASAFFAAEEYHQDYYTKNPIRYRYYRFGCGRDKRLAELWGEPAKDAH